MSQITAISLEKALSKEQFNSTTKVLSNLSQLNLFIGQNNSGKSRLIRSLFEADLYYQESSLIVQIIDKAIDDFNKTCLGLVEDYNIKEYQGDNSGHLVFGKIEYLKERDKSIFSNLEQLIEERKNTVFGTKSAHLRDRHSNRIMSETFSEAINKLDQITREEKSKLKKINPFHNRLYFPVLRGLRPIINSTGDPYLERTIKDYFPLITDQEKENIFTGLSLFKDLRRLLLGPNKDRKKVREFEKFLSTNFFPGKDINIVPREGEDVVYVLIGEDEQPIYELGDGIQTIIILTYPLFFNMGKEMLVFIEEPEHFLHPGMQRLLIETFLKPEFSNFQYFITTHSNHFLELMNESNKITLFKVSQGNTAQSSNVTLELKPSMNLLDSLGVNNASVLLSNCSIWVEGITDRLYLKKYLEVYWKETPPEVILKEDFHFSFVEYSGGNLTHWNFDESNGDNINAKKITNRIFLISDSDFDKNGKITKSKQKRFENLSNALGDNFYLLPVKEIENTLSKVIVEKVICKKEDITLQNLTVKKGVRNNFDKENLGDWICKKYDGLNRKYVNGNTLHDKVKFAQLATEMITDISDLSTNAVELCEKITAFILSHNEKID